MSSEEMERELNRRNFLAAAAAATCACALSCPFATAAKKDEDEEDDDEGDDVPAVPTGPVDIGALSDFNKDGAWDKWINSRHFIVCREKGKLYATTAICTHKQALLKVKDNQIICPKHNSRFNYEGKPIPKPNGRMGLAKKSLSRFKISVDDKKHVIVDTSKPFDPTKWDDPAAFVKIA